MTKMKISQLNLVTLPVTSTEQAIALINKQAEIIYRQGEVMKDQPVHVPKVYRKQTAYRRVKGAINHG